MIVGLLLPGGLFKSGTSPALDATVQNRWDQIGQQIPGGIPLTIEMGIRNKRPKARDSMELDGCDYSGCSQKPEFSGQNEHADHEI